MSSLLQCLNHSAPVFIPGYLGKKACEEWMEQRNKMQGYDCQVSGIDQRNGEKKKKLKFRGGEDPTKGSTIGQEQMYVGTQVG